MSHWHHFIQRLAGDERAAVSIEYAIIASLVAVAVVAGATQIGIKLAGTFGLISATAFK